MGKVHVSVVVPAHNEEKYVKRCIDSIKRAAKGKVIMTMDCDNRMTPGTIAEAYMLLRSGRYIGGGAPIRFERYSLPLWFNDILCRIGFGITGLHCGIFWAKKSTFEEIGSFVDKRAMEDVATAQLLKKYGKAQGKKYGVLRKNHLINSTRKYDDLGDWLYLKLMVKNAGAMIKAAFGKTEEYDKLLDEMFYSYNDIHR